MAFTKITNAGFGLTTGTLVGVAASFSSTVSVGGTLTYEDVTNVDSVGLITARNGIEVTDKGVQVGTGATVDSAADNVLTFLTGGSERARIDSSGRLNIGATSNSYANALLQTNTSDGSFFVTTYSHLLLQNKNASTTDWWNIAPRNGGSLTIGNGAPDGNGTITDQKIVIDSSGRLLLGTTTEGYSSADDLTIATSGDTGITIRSGTSDEGNIFFSDGTSGNAEYRGAIRYYHDVNELEFMTAASGRMRIDSSGNMGLGTASADSPFHVKNSANTVARFESSDSIARIVLKDNAGQSRLGTNGDNITFHTSSSETERMRIDSSGNIGIGLTSPAHELHVVDASTPEIVVEDTTNNVKAYLGSSDSNGRIGTLSNHHFQLRTNDTERMRIDTSGNVSIGHAGSADSLLIIGGNAITTAKPTVTIAPSSGNGSITIRGGEPTLCFDQTGGNDQKIIYDASTNLIFSNGTLDSNTERIRIDSSGRLLLGVTSAPNTDSGNILQVVSSSGGYISFARNDTTVTNGDSLGGLRWYGNDSNGTYQPCAYIFAHADGTHQTDDKATRLVFSTTTGGDASPTERMRIDDQGIMYSVSENHGHGAYVTQSAGTVKFIFRGHHSASAGSYSSGTIAFTVWSNGNVQNINNSYGAISDVKLKENIVDASSQWNDIKAVQVRKYNFKESTGQPTHTQLGVVAQEIETVSPGLVYETTDTDDQGNDLGTVTKSVNYSVLYMKAIKALQEAQTRIESLEARLDAGGL